MNTPRQILLAAVCTGIGLSLSLHTPTLASTPARTTTTSAPAPTTASATALYRTILDKYLAAQWDTLPADLAKTKDIAVMTKDQQADVTYIRQAVADGRPSWWDPVKQGKKTTLQTKIWQKTFNPVFDPTLEAGKISMQQVGSQITLSMNWSTADMDSTTIAEHGFTKGDLAHVTIWSSLEIAQLYTSLAVQKLSGLSEQEPDKLNRFMAFRGTLAAAYYGTPRARRWTAFLSCDAYLASHLNADNFIPRRPLAVMLEEEIVSHPAKYPSFRIPPNQKADTIEGTLATNLMTQFERNTLTLAEDKALREAIWNFALANSVSSYASGKVTLPSKLTMALNPAEDADGPVKRGAWLMEEIAQPGVHNPAPASKPNTTTKPEGTIIIKP